MEKVRNWHVKLLQFIAVMTSIILLAVSLHHLQMDSGTKIVDLELSPVVEESLQLLFNFISTIIIAGLSLHLLSIFSSNNDTLMVITVFFIP